MITVKKTDKGFERIGGNPTLKSLDGKTKAPLQVILHESWTDEQRAEFGIYRAKPFDVPEGKEIDGAETFEMKDGKLLQKRPVKDRIEKKPEPSKYDRLISTVEDLSKRVAQLERQISEKKPVKSQIRQ